MPLDIQKCTDTFNAFAKFAQEKFDAGEKKAVLDAKFHKPLEGHRILAIGRSKTDEVHKWTRDFDEWTVNDRTRKIFRTAVAGMFGGESRIPPSVKKAMLMSDYDQGKPLTARRVVAVKAAIDAYRVAQKSADPDMKPLPIGKAKAKEMIAASAELLGAELDEATARDAADLLRRHGNRLPAKTARVLSNFIVRSAATEGLDGETVANVANDMRGWREFDFGDPRLRPMGGKFVQRQNDYVKQMLPDASKFSPKTPDVFQQVYSDADRGEWTINGKTFKVGSDPDAIVAEILSAVKGTAARKVVSCLLHQGGLADLETLFCRGGALVGDANAKDLQEEFLYELPGGDLFIHRDAGRDGYGILADADVHYGLEISKDGKTATVTVGIDKHLTINGLKHAESRIGKATIVQKTVIDLTKEVPEVVDATFSQTFTPDEVAE